MLLYHGTSEENAWRVLAGGIKPRAETATSNWAAHPSRPDCVYLTELYAGFFAANAAPEDGKWGIIEVDTDKLDEKRLLPDEDAMAQAFTSYDLTQLQPGTWAAKVAEAIQGMDLAQRTAWFRERLPQFAPQWQASVKALGNCAYHGTVPTKAITKVVLYTPSSNPPMSTLCLDPTISIQNAQHCRLKYQALTAWLLGGTLQVEAFGRMLAGPGELEEMARVAQVRELRVLKGLVAL